MAYQFNKTKLDVCHSCINEVSLFFSAFKLTPWQFHHATLPCCFADFGRYLPWEIGTVVLHVSYPSISVELALFALRIFC